LPIKLFQCSEPRRSAALERPDPKTSELETPLVCERDGENNVVVAPTVAKTHVPADNFLEIPLVHAAPSVRLP
jgi:hypothetical protein